jgi:hypothetical protein
MGVQLPIAVDEVASAFGDGRHCQLLRFPRQGWQAGQVTLGDAASVADTVICSTPARQ